MDPDAPERPHRPVAIATLVVLAGAALWLAARQSYYASWMDDDAFISFRYALNWANGHGVVFNVGERVEGYTNFLWMALMSLAARLGADIPAAAQLLGRFFAFATLAVAVVLCRAMLPASVDAVTRAVAGLLAALVLCFSESWAVWSVSGLENTFEAFLIGSMLALYFRYLDRPRRPTVAAVFALGALLGMTHPESLLFVGILGCHLAWVCIRGRRTWADLAAATAVFAALFGTYFAWRWTYFGDLHPNTYYVKTGLSALVLRRGLGYVGQAATAVPLFALVAVAGPFAMLSRRWRCAKSALALVAVLTHLAYVLAIGGEEFPAFRLLVALHPIAAALLGVACAHAAAALAGARSPRPAPLFAAVIAAALLTTNAVALYRSPKVRTLDVAIEMHSLAKFRAAGLFLGSTFPPDTVLAYSGAGVVAFYSKLPLIDTLGLTDRHIARSEVEDLGAGRAGHEKGDGAYVFGLRPDLVMFNGMPISSHGPFYKGDRELLAQPGFHEIYVPRTYTVPVTLPGDGIVTSMPMPMYVRR